MKLRLRHNSVRLRLMRAEVAQFEREGRVIETIEMGPAADDRFSFELVANPDSSSITATIGNGMLTVSAPQAIAREWTATDRVLMEEEQPLGNGRLLRILVEKDFACLEPRPGEDERDAFPHPGAGPGITSCG